MRQDIMLISPWSDHIAATCNMLRSLNIDVLHFERIQDAKAELLEKSPAFLLLDNDVEHADSFLIEMADMVLYPPPYIIVAGSFEQGRDYASVLNIGADVCIGKPAGAEVIISVIRAVLRREGKLARLHQGRLLPRIEHKALLIDPLRRTVTMRGEFVPLTVKEFDLLYFLAFHGGTAFTRKEIFESVWKETYQENSTGVPDHISSLRRKLKLGKTDKEYIQTVFGVGYRFASAEQK